MQSHLFPRNRRWFNPSRKKWTLPGLCVFAVFFYNTFFAVAFAKSAEARLALQMDDAGICAVLELTLFDEEAALMMHVHDTNHNQHLDPEEAKKLAALMVVRAGKGLTLYWQGQPMAAIEGKAFLADIIPNARALSASALLKLTPAPDDKGTLEIRLAPDSQKMWISPQSLGAFVFTSTMGQVAADGRALTEPLELLPGSSLALTLVKVTSHPP